MSLGGVGRLALAVSYPQNVPADASDFVFKVDGGGIRAVDLGNRIVLLREITRNEDDLPRLASCSFGRTLRDNAILHWDESTGAAVLSQEIPASATSHEMKVSFETFADSCDWWLACTAAEPVDPATFPEMVIRP